MIVATFRRFISAIQFAYLMMILTDARVASFHLFPNKNHARGVSLFQLRGGETTTEQDLLDTPDVVNSRHEDPFPVISRFVGGTWVNTYNIFNGIHFQQGEDRIRYVQWEIDGRKCKVLLRTEETGDPIVLQGESIGNGVIRFDAQGLPFEYLFHQIGTDTILVSRTEQSACEECGHTADEDKDDAEATSTRNSTASGSSKTVRLDCGSMVLTDDNSCVQTILHMEDGSLIMMEVIRGERKE